ncbi:MAG: DoxX family membrane protein [Planctomycetes bacterium]|nr:DoxX family membrane protein [Planctomycetota bacterium]
MVSTSDPASSSLPRTIARWLLGAVLVFAGVSHLTFGRQDFYAQVPPWLPLDVDFVVVASGVVEIVLGGSLLLLARWPNPVGRNRHCGLRFPRSSKVCSIRASRMAEVSRFIFKQIHDLLFLIPANTYLSDSPLLLIPRTGAS